LGSVTFTLFYHLSNIFPSELKFEKQQ
jgi:hypothetical protein